jgi:hypothetical protein
MPSSGFLVLFGVIALLVLLPTRRLFLAGWKAPWLTSYFLFVVALALFVAELFGPARYLIPILVLAYIAPFITARDGMARLRGRLRPPPASPGTRGPGGGRTDGRSGPTRSRVGDQSFRAGGFGSGPFRDPRAVRRPPMKNVTPKEAPGQDAPR